MKVTLKCPICGKVFEKWPSQVRGGTCSRKCGRVQFAPKVTKRKNPNFLHGMTKTPTFRSYMHARQRCSNPRHIRYPEYGGRGIEFRFKTFKQFFTEVGSRPDGLTLDRIEVNGHYEPGNVRWATPTEQAGNRRNSL